MGQELDNFRNRAIRETLFIGIGGGIEEIERIVWGVIIDLRAAATIRAAAAVTANPGPEGKVERRPTLDILNLYGFASPARSEEVRNNLREWQRRFAPTAGATVKRSRGAAAVQWRPPARVDRGREVWPELADRTYDVNGGAPLAGGVQGYSSCRRRRSFFPNLFFIIFFIPSAEDLLAPLLGGEKIAQVFPLLLAD